MFCRLEQVFDPDLDVHVRHVRRLLVVYLVGGALLFALALAFFCFLMKFYHLGWTVLTNNFFREIMAAMCVSRMTCFVSVAGTLNLHSGVSID